MAELKHCPVLLEECIRGLNIRPEGVYVDGTLGRAGHSREIARRLTTGRLICIDRDQAALDAARERLAPWMDRVTLVHSNFSRIPEVLDELGLPGADGVLLDLGVSSPQLDDASRGFSYQQDAPLDMRMDQTQPLTAAVVVNEWPEEELRWAFSRYGEERYARQIAAAIVRRRDRDPLRPRWSWWRSSAPPCPPRPCGRSSTRPSVCFRRSASPSTMSLPPALRRWTPSSPGSIRAGGCASSPSTLWRTGW